jgi:4-hydroxythreonine-4-phosphate dehydrogenase
MQTKRRTHKRKPVLAVTLGDPAGIGPEIVARLFASFQPVRSTALVIGSLPVWEPFLPWLKSRAVVMEDGWPPAKASRESPSVHFLDTGCRDRFRPGRDTRGGGRHAGMALELACRLAKQGSVDGLVTAPLSKKSLNLAGYRFTGHTEFLARYFGTPTCQMLMVHRALRVVPLTRHIPVRRISSSLTREGILSALEVLDGALKQLFGIRRPRIAVTGLNPHAGEGGLLGREDLAVIAPAVRQARRRGIDAAGPFPGDALFQRALDGTFDALVTMYHDQGLIPFKMLARRRGVNVTIGLPIVRTSVDHGVAYDLAGTGAASFESIKHAYWLAERLAARSRIKTS